MAPKRKKSRLGTPKSAQQRPGDQSIDTDMQNDQSSTLVVDVDACNATSPLPKNAEGAITSAPAKTRTPVSQTNRASWYSPWRTASKASPVVAQPTNESISVQQGTTSESSERAPVRRPSQALSKGMRGSRKSIPVIAEPTRVHATSDASDKSRPSMQSGEKLRRMDSTADGTEKNERRNMPDLQIEEAPLPPDPMQGVSLNTGDVSDDARSMASGENTKPRSGASWFGWWSRPDGYAGEDDRPKDERKKREAEFNDEASKTPLPGTPEDQSVQDPLKDAGSKAEIDPKASQQPPKPGNQIESKKDNKTVYHASYRSWFGLWSSAQNQQAQQGDEQPTGNAASSTAEGDPALTVTGEPEAVANATTIADDLVNDSTAKSKPKPSGSEEEQPKSSGWAFWSTESKAKDADSTDGDLHKSVGELAVAHTPSQSHPEAAQFNEQRKEEPKAKAGVKRAGSLLKPSRSPKQEKLKADVVPSATPTPPVSQIPSPSGASTPVSEEPPKTSAATRKSASKPNLTLPSFVDTYPPAPTPGLAERFNNYFWSSLHLQEPSRHAAHVFRLQTPQRVKKAIAIGVHGFFPTPIFQRVLGQPTGTSIRFANHAASAIRLWCQDRQPEIKDVEIEKVALEGEGYIADRVSTLWKLLLNWLSHLRQADFILLSCHSQGVPVAIMLLAKLIQLGCLNNNVKIGVCAMAGISMGPFPEFKSRFFGGSALELFDFGDCDSKVSQSYADGLDVCLRHGVRITYIGSIDDQLVSLESSLFMSLMHPYVSRAVFIDGRLHASNFLTHLVAFALKLRNLGISDHGLIHELSAPLAGSLVGGEGHSRIYDDPAVYRLAIDFALESTNYEPSSNPAIVPLSATDRVRQEKDAAFVRRSSAAGVPASMAAANSIRRGSFSTSANLPGTPPTMTRYEAPVSSTTANPFYLPWAVRGMLEQDEVKRGMRAEVETLVREFEEWRPTTKGLKDVRWRLEGVKSML